MAEVELTIAGRQYALSCRDGDEAHLDHLSTIVDAKARQTQGTTEIRQLLYAALFLADEVDALKREAAGRQGQLALEAEARAGDDILAGRLEAIADHVERLAQRIA